MTFQHCAQNYLPHDKLKSMFSFLSDFVFKGGDKTFIRLCHTGEGFWGRKQKGDLVFSKTLLKTSKSFNRDLLL